MFFKEFSYDFNKRYGTMIPAHEQRSVGYCSLYYFFKEDADKVVAAQSSKGLNRLPVISNRLVMDYDDGDATIWADFPKIAALGAPFRIYSSGGKGYHVEIRTEVMKGTHIPFSHRSFVKKLGFAVDESLYQHGRLISNVGRIHPKTGRPKALVMEFFDGEPLSVPEVIPTRKIIDEQPSNGFILRQAFSRLNNVSSREPGIGNRHGALWGIAKDLKMGGISYETALELMFALNEIWTEPKKPEEVEAAVSQAFDVYMIAR